MVRGLNERFGNMVHNTLKLKLIEFISFYGKNSVMNGGELTN